MQYPIQRRKVTRAEPPAAWSLARLVIIPAFVLLWVYVAWRWGFKPFAVLVYGGMSIVAFAAYALDKRAALRSAWRTPESTLHLIDLAGGWPGALCAQQWLRHKTSKTSFVVGYWLTVIANVIAFVAWHTGALRLL